MVKKRVFAEALIGRLFDRARLLGSRHWRRGGCGNCRSSRVGSQGLRRRGGKRAAGSEAERQLWPWLESQERSQRGNMNCR